MGDIFLVTAPTYCKEKSAFLARLAHPKRTRIHECMFLTPCFSLRSPLQNYNNDCNDNYKTSTVPNALSAPRGQEVRDSLKSPNELAAMTPEARRRYERNQREKRRSFMISKQIKDLQVVLSQMRIPFKNNKCSVLVSCVNFIRRMQQTNAKYKINNDGIRHILGQAQNLFYNRVAEKERRNHDPRGYPCSHHDMRTNITGAASLANGVDYQSIFSSLSIPMGVASQEGKIVDINRAFAKELGENRKDLVGKNVSNLIEVEYKGAHEKLGEAFARNKGNRDVHTMPFRALKRAAVNQENSKSEEPQQKRVSTSTHSDQGEAKETEKQVGIVGDKEADVIVKVESEKREEQEVNEEGKEEERKRQITFRLMSGGASAEGRCGSLWTFGCVQGTAEIK